MFDLSNTDVIINGHDCSGFSEDADALLLPVLELAGVKRGADGKMVAASSGNKGGPLELKFLPGTASDKFFSILGATQKAGGNVQYNGYIRYNNIGVTVSLLKGVLTSMPSGITIGKGEVGTQVYIIEFETITPDYSASTSI